MIQKLGKIGFVTGIGLVSALILWTVFFPDTYGAILPYRFYYVLTNSMEPTVATNSLALVKTCEDSTQIQQDDIIVFRANRFGEAVTIMHRFSHTERNGAGELVYKTHPEESETPDIYETKREDILGVYLWHIPYAGKVVLFLKSEFGLLWICQIVVILLIKALVSARWEKACVD